MKSIWTLTVKTSLPEVCWGPEDLETEVLAFESFADARKALREKLHGYAFSSNAMFDGTGNMIRFKKYRDEAWEPEEDDGEGCPDFLTQTLLTEFYNAFMAIFRGEAYDLSPLSAYGHYFDGMIGVDVEDGVVTMYGEDDGPCNGYDPRISSNMFDMQEEKDYFLYVDDLFGQEVSSELYIDLKKTTIR